MKPQSKINPSRLSFARRHNGLSMKQLAELVGVQSRSVSGFEKGEYEPSAQTFLKIVETLGFPTEFFFGEDLYTPSKDSASFRALTKMTAGSRDSVLSSGGIALLLNAWIEARFRLPDPRIPDLRGEEPEAAAEQTRSMWGLGHRPIKSLVHLLEAHGVRVFSLAENDTSVDAFSIWHQNIPVVFLNTKKSAERSRFDAAHELGHLVLHKHGAPHGQEAESQANAFAAALLMPASDVFRTVRGMPTLGRLVQLKKRWNVSAAALAHRLWKLRYLSDWQYRSTCIEMGDMRRNEPDPSPRERSQLFEKVFANLKAEGVSKAQVARELRVYRRHIEELTFGLSVKSGSQTSRRPTASGPNFELVK